MSDDKTIIAESIGATIFKKSETHYSCLVQYNGAHLGERYVLDKPVIYLGRLPENEIIIDEQSVSRKHARFITTNNIVEVEDLNATNGTFVNDKRISGRTQLRDGDYVRTGTILFKFFAHDNIDNIFQDKMYRMAVIDAGTQIFNKKHLLKSLESEIKFSRAYNRPLSLIYYDLDHFKKVNDTYGHNAGDFILKETARLTASVIRKQDIFGRFGGEEFCVILPETPLKIAVDLAERIRKTVEQHSFNFNGTVLKQTVSLGVAEYKNNMKDSKDFLDEADQKLYQSKKSGRNRVTYT